MADLWQSLGAPGGWLVRSSLQASVLVVLILLVGRVAGRHLSGRWRCALWLLVLVRLALPVAPPARWSLFNLAGAVERHTARPRPVAAPIETPLATVRPPVPGAPAPASASDAVEPVAQARAVGDLPVAAGPLPTPQAVAPPAGWTAYLPRVLAIVWAAGAVVLSLRLAACNLRFGRRVTASAAACSPEARELLRRCRVEMRVRRCPALLETPAVEVPALFGLIRPKLLLPEHLARELTEGQLRHVFRHELAHLKRRDVPLDWLATVLSVVHWFNPLIWLALRRMRADRELACDEAVLAHAPEADARSYGRTILRLLEGLSRPSHPAGVVAVVESRNEITRRIEMIAHFARNRSYRPVLGIALLTILGLAALTDAQADPRGEAKAKTPATAPAAAAPAAIDKKLAKSIKRLSFAEIELKDVIQYLREYSDANIYVDWPALLAVGIESSAKISMEVRDVTVRRALELLVRDVSGTGVAAGSEAAWVVDGDVVLLSIRTRLTDAGLTIGKEVPTGREPEAKADAELRKKLTRTVQRLSFADIDFKDVLQFLREYSGVNIHVVWRGLSAVGVEPGRKISLDLRNVSVVRALEVVLRAASGQAKPGTGSTLAYSIRDGVLTISTQAQLTRGMTDGPWIRAVTGSAPGYSRTLSFVRPGRIAAVAVKEGDVVKAGQMLVQLDDAAEREQLAQHKANDHTIRVRAAETQRTLCETALKRVALLVKRGSAPRPDLDKAKAEVELARLGLELAKSERDKAAHVREQARILLERMRLVSPIDAKVEKVFVGAGESVAALTPVVRVVKIANDPLQLDVPVPVTRAMKLKKGQLAFVGIGEEPLPLRGRVVSIASTADVKTQTLTVRVQVPNPAARPAGQHALVNFPPPK